MFYDNTINMENLQRYLILVAHFISRGKNKKNKKIKNKEEK